MFPRLSELTTFVPAATQVEEAVQLDEGRGEMAKLIEKWMDHNKIYSFEGSRGEQRFEKLVRAIGYANMSEFFGDNPGVMEAMVNWISSQSSSEWAEKMQSELPGDDEEADEDDDK